MTGNVAPPGADKQENRQAVLDGFACVPKGIRLFVRTPAYWVLGLLPAFVSLAVVIILAVVLLFLVDDAVRWMTPFADAWSTAWRASIRVSIGLAVVGAFIVGVVISFAALTNIIGQPFFELMSDNLERELGNPPAGVDTPWYKTLPRATASSIFMLFLYLLFIVPLILLGFVPVVGQTVAPALTALVSGYFLSIEILSIPLERRGMTLRERLRFHWRHRAATTAFGVGFFLLFLIPVMNVVAMPGAILGGTLLARRLTGAPAE